MADAIQLVGGDARLDVLADHLQNLGCQAAGNPHAGNVFGGLDGDGHGWTLSIGRRLA